LCGACAPHTRRRATPHTSRRERSAGRRGALSARAREECDAVTPRKARRVCHAVGFDHAVCLIWCKATRSPSARDGPRSLHGVVSGRGRRVKPRTTRVLCFTPAPALSCAARRKYTWKRRVREGNSECGWQYCCLTPPPPVHTPVCPCYWCWILSARVCSAGRHGGTHRLHWVSTRGGAGGC
jgi:hypothetical protein